MEKIKTIVIGTNNEGKYREICDLLPIKVKKHSLKEFKILSPEETGVSFKENSYLKASYFAKKTNKICLSDDSGLEIELLNGAPGIHSARWAGTEKNFNNAINRVYKEMNDLKKDWKNYKNLAKFTCCLTICWPDGKSFFSEGIVKGKISHKKKGNNGFGYDPIFIPDGFDQTFGEMKPELKMSIDHRFKAFEKIKIFFN